MNGSNSSYSEGKKPEKQKQKDTGKNSTKSNSTIAEKEKSELLDDEKDGEREYKSIFQTWFKTNPPVESKDSDNNQAQKDGPSSEVKSVLGQKRYPSLTEILSSHTRKEEISDTKRQVETLPKKDKPLDLATKKIAKTADKADIVASNSRSESQLNNWKQIEASPQNKSQEEREKRSETFVGGKKKEKTGRNGSDERLNKKSKETKHPVLREPVNEEPVVTNKSQSKSNAVWYWPFHKHSDSEESVTEISKKDNHTMIHKPGEEHRKQKGENPDETKQEERKKRLLYNDDRFIENDDKIEIKKESYEKSEAKRLDVTETKTTEGNKNNTWNWYIPKHPEIEVIENESGVKGEDSESEHETEKESADAWKDIHVCDKIRGLMPGFLKSAPSNEKLDKTETSDEEVSTQGKEKEKKSSKTQEEKKIEPRDPFYGIFGMPEPKGRENSEGIIRKKGTEKDTESKHKQADYTETKSISRESELTPSGKINDQYGKIERLRRRLFKDSPSDESLDKEKTSVEEKNKKGKNDITSDSQRSSLIPHWRWLGKDSHLDSGPTTGDKEKDDEKPEKKAEPKDDSEKSKSKVQGKSKRKISEENVTSKEEEDSSPKKIRTPDESTSFIDSLYTRKRKDSDNEDKRKKTVDAKNTERNSPSILSTDQNHNEEMEAEELFHHCISSLNDSDSSDPTWWVVNLRSMKKGCGLNGKPKEHVIETDDEEYTKEKQISEKPENSEPEADDSKPTGPYPFNLPTAKKGKEEDGKNKRKTIVNETMGITDKDLQAKPKEEKTAERDSSRKLTDNKKSLDTRNHTERSYANLTYKKESKSNQSENDTKLPNNPPEVASSENNTKSEVKLSNKPLETEKHIQKQATSEKHPNREGSSENNAFKGDGSTGKKANGTKTESEERASDSENINSPYDNSKNPFKSWGGLSQDHYFRPKTTFSPFVYLESEESDENDTRSIESETSESENQTTEGDQTQYSMHYPDPLGIKPPGTRNAFEDDVSAQDPFLVWEGPPYPWNSSQAQKRTPRSLFSRLRKLVWPQREQR